MRYYINNGAYIGTIGEIEGAKEITKAEFESEIKRIESEQKFEQEPTPEERLESVEKRTDVLESTTDDMILLMADLIGGE